MDFYNIEIFMTGKSSDGRGGFSEKELTEIVDDTNEAITTSNLKIPIKLGHDDKEQWSKGWVKNIRKMGNKIIADFFNIPDMIAEKINSGYLPSKSIELTSNFITSAGKKLKNIIMGLALLGTEQPAFPYLKDNQTGMAFSYRIRDYSDWYVNVYCTDNNFDWYNELFNDELDFNSIFEDATQYPFIGLGQDKTEFQIEDIDTDEDSYKCRVKNPRDFDDMTFRLIDLDAEKGIKAICGIIKGSDNTKIQSYLFDKNRWDKQGVVSWLNSYLLANNNIIKS